MRSLTRFAFVSAVLAAFSVDAQAGIIPAVPQSELAAFCQEYGAARPHLATFFLDDGLRLRGHVNCKTVTFTLSMILPPID